MYNLLIGKRVCVCCWSKHQANLLQFQMYEAGPELDVADL